MSRKNFLYNAWRSDDEEEDEQEEKTEIGSHDASEKAGEIFF